MDIENWLLKFKNGWESKNIDEVMSLFTVDVKYYETPFGILENIEQVHEEWIAIREQNEINLSYELYSKEENRYTIIWYLEYLDNKQNKNNFGGTYLIKLNEFGLCSEFRHCCEKK